MTSLNHLHPFTATTINQLDALSPEPLNERECIEDGCFRPPYEDLRCKTHRDLHLWKTGKLAPRTTPCSAPQPGTNAGYQWHQNHHQDACDRCLYAHAVERAKQRNPVARRIQRNIAPLKRTPPALRVVEGSQSSTGRHYSWCLCRECRAEA